MPRISEFYGIFIYTCIPVMSSNTTSLISMSGMGNIEHFSIETGKQLAGRLPGKQTGRVKEWINARRAELDANWQRALYGEALKSINPI